MRFKLESAIHLIVGLSITTTLLTGCGLTPKQISMTQSFGQATTNISKLGDEFVNIRNGIIEMNQALVSIDTRKTARDFKFDRPASPEATATRIAATKALKSYGELLVELVTKGRTENLKKVANSFSMNTKAALKKNVTGSIDKIVSGLGALWLEHKKAAAVKDIITTYEQPVNQLADLLIEDFSLDDSAFGYIKTYHTTAKRLKNASMRLVNADAKERERALQALVLSEKAISRANEINKNAKEAIIGFKKANIELVKMVNTEIYSADSVKAYNTQIQEMVNIYQVLNP